MATTTPFYYLCPTLSPVQLLATCFFLCIAINIALSRRRSYTKIPTQNSPVTHHGVLLDKPQIIKCNISHCRLLPKTHQFTYSYLSLGIPVKSSGSSWESYPSTTRWWLRCLLNVPAEAHLNRGIYGKTLAENVDGYLKQNGLDSSQYPYVYLVTSATFFGYSFNPASFWYLYSENRQLMHVIAEVNNTFGERRMYIFSNTEEGGKQFKQIRDKDFHVSPFSSRKGSYVLSTADPASGNIAITTTLRSSKCHPKLIARWWSIAPAIDPTALSTLDCLSLLIMWGWTVLLTFPRILIQAFLLAQVRKLQIWYRPEPRESSVARQATRSEAFLASILIRYLRFLLDSAPRRLCLSVGHGGMNQEEALYIHTPLDMRLVHDDGRSELHLRITTPQFYRQMVTYESIAGYLSYTLLHPYSENHTARSEHAESLIATIQELEAVSRYRKATERHVRFWAPLPGICWVIYSLLRSKKPSRGSYPDPGLPSARVSSKVAEISVIPREHTIEKTYLLDDFVRNHCSCLVQLQYMGASIGLQCRAWFMAVVGGE
ncbi:DUF1365-domain-containing protein [Camillea tinctor]|nr:DUF1365-domain-containing protein [Camillea tinctor]